MGDAGEKDSRKKRGPQVVDGTEGSLRGGEPFSPHGVYGLRIDGPP